MFISGERFDAWLRRHVLLIDAGLAGALSLVCVLPYLFGADLLLKVLSIALILPLVWRRRHPVPAAAAALLVAGVQWLSLWGDSTSQLLAGDVAVPMTIYAVSAYGPRWASRAGLLAGLVGAVLGGLVWPEMGGALLDHVIIALALGTCVTAAWAIGALRGVRRERLVALTERARLLEVERDQQARLAVSAERTRIAREMHDVVAHSLAVMIAQADGGRYAAGTSPAAAADALQTIGDTGRRALGEMRRLLGVLRAEAEDGRPGGAGRPGEDGRPGEVEPAARLPQPGLADLDTLVDQVRSGGLQVRLELERPQVAVDPGLGLAAYRIVQEGLTNVIKHAGPAARAEVALRWRRGLLEIDVLDDGRGAAARGVPGGHGLIGMRERAGAYGGDIWAGPRPGGGHALHARIPVPS